MKKERKNVVIKKNTSYHLAPGGRGWHAVPGEGVLNKEHFMGTPSSPLRGTSPARGEVNSGFTLIELLVVVLIIGILATVAVPQYQKAIKKVHFTKMRTFASTLVKASQVAYLRNGSFPHLFEELDVTVPEDMTIVPTKNSATTASDYCVIGKEFYCCLTFPVPNYAGAGMICGSNDFSLGLSHYYINSTGQIISATSCAEKTGKETLCPNLPGATNVSGTSLLTPTNYAFGGYTWYRID